MKEYIKIERELFETIINIQGNESYASNGTYMGVTFKIVTGKDSFGNPISKLIEKMYWNDKNIGKSRIEETPHKIEIVKGD